MNNLILFPNKKTQFFSDLRKASRAALKNRNDHLTSVALCGLFSIASASFIIHQSAPDENKQKPIPKPQIALTIASGLIAAFSAHRAYLSHKDLKFVEDLKEQASTSSDSSFPTLAKD
jgi:hypothetical protein